ncbi:MAG: hypothetical protein FWG75_07075 [Cystobacterineae bacterium]|nr:hypothetical protein [Cystobacterineae bacterium]
MLPSVLLSLLLTQSYLSEAEVFEDNAVFFARAGSAKGLKTGQEVWVVDAETAKILGSALVMELWEGMARLSLDALASKAAGAKRIRYLRAMEEGFCARPMSGKARLLGVGAFQKLVLSNESGEDWSRCHLLLSTNRLFQLERLPAQSTAEIFLEKFAALENVRIVPLEYVWVECLEGKAKLAIEP